MSKTLINIIGCPYCDNGQCLLQTEQRVIAYKNKKHKVTAYFYVCNICKRSFTTGESDDKTLNQIPGYPK